MRGTHEANLPPVSNDLPKRLNLPVRKSSALAAIKLFFHPKNHLSGGCTVEPAAPATLVSFSSVFFDVPEAGMPPRYSAPRNALPAPPENSSGSGSRHASE
jgi:hypothetical protein